VLLTEGAVYPRTLTWKGNKRNAPETPPIDVKKETTKATTSGNNGFTSIPDTGKNIFNLYVSKDCCVTQALF
jgi:hypothetical protein